MSIFRPFQSVRPAPHLASAIAALPYDVYSSREARKITEANPYSFLKIDRAETQFPSGINAYTPYVYERARDTLTEMIGRREFIYDEQACFYIYALTMDGRTQTGLVGCASIDDYQNGLIRRHENTLASKEQDRISHIDTCSAQTGPIFLACRPKEELREILQKKKSEDDPIYDFVSDDGIRHQVWRISEEETIAHITEIAAQIPHLYIADGHHRAASAVHVGLKRRQANPNHNGTEEYNYFLSVLFPSDELVIYDYNRLVRNHSGRTVSDILMKLHDQFAVLESSASPTRPAHRGEIGMYIHRQWYLLQAKESIRPHNPVGALDVSLLQDYVLTPLFGITDPKRDARISFMGGIRGLDALSAEADACDGIAFAMYPTSMDELLAVADAGMLMPPKSTWFEPKLRSGLFIHRF